MAKEQLIPDGKSNIDTSANFLVHRPTPQAQRPTPDAIAKWDETQAHIRDTHKPQSYSEIWEIPCITPRGATFTARVEKPARKPWETDAEFEHRQGTVRELQNYRFPGDGFRDEDGKLDDMSYHQPAKGPRLPGKNDAGEYTWPVEIQNQQSRKIEIVKTWWHRDLAEYCGKPLPALIRLDHQAELDEFRKWKESQAKK